MLGLRHDSPDYLPADAALRIADNNLHPPRFGKRVPVCDEISFTVTVPVVAGIDILLYYAVN